MGCICSCLENQNDPSAHQSESEMVPTSTNGIGVGKEISKKMSNPSITFLNKENKPKNCTISGTGLALACVSVEQDAAYWEWHVGTQNGSESSTDKSSDEEFFENDEGEEEDNENCIKVGVATKKNRKFYRILEANDDGDDVPMEDDGTALMRAIPNLKHGDTVGVAVQQSDLPMIQFLVNGEPLHHLAINRFRGTVYPSIWLPSSTVDYDNDEEEEEENENANSKEEEDKSDKGTKAIGSGSFTVTFVVDEDKFNELAPNARFGPLIAARGII